MSRFENGYFKIWRKLLDSDIGRDPVVLSIFLHLMSMANRFSSWVRYRGVPTQCPPGGMVTSITELIDRTGASRTQVRRALKYLEVRETILVKTDRRGKLITIPKYWEYQNTIDETSHPPAIRQPPNGEENTSTCFPAPYSSVPFKNPAVAAPPSPIPGARETMPNGGEATTTGGVSPLGGNGQPGELAKEKDAARNHLSLTFPPLEPELRGNANFEYALGWVSPAVRRTWLERHDLSDLRVSLINGVNKYLGEVNANDASQVSNWGGKLINWVKIERHLRPKARLLLAAGIKTAEEPPPPPATADELARAEMSAGQKFGGIGKSVLKRLTEKREAIQ